MTVSIRASLVIGAVALAVVLCTAFADPPAETLAGTPTKPSRWSYGGEGGPEHWGELDAKNSPCSTGDQQSPIDLTHAIPAGAEAPAPRWTPVRGGMVVNTGRTIQIDIDGGGAVMIGDTAYTLTHVDFHHPSEHTIDGKSFPLEAHLVHASSDGKLAVIGVLFDEGAANPALEPVWATAPAREGKAAVAFEIDPAKLIPKGSAAYRYEGSLTAPPCSETVTWTVLSQPMTASHAQIEAFASLFPYNARPVQPLNRRYVLKTAD